MTESAPLASPSARQVSSVQWRSGIAAWLGWMFDGLDMHIYTLVAVPFVAELMGGLSTRDPAVAVNASWIQAAFLVGWALGGAFFGIIGDRIGRSRTLVLTILTYAVFTGMGYCVQTWWELAGARFLAALGIGGEWAVGAALLAETWPVRWRPWLAAGLQSAVNVGILLATWAGYLLATSPHRDLFLIGIVPALLTLWIRVGVPETGAWSAAHAAGGKPTIRALFSPELRRTTWISLSVCGCMLTAHWAFMFWSLQQLRSLPEVAALPVPERNRLASLGLLVLMVTSIIGNFSAAVLARWIGWRRVIAGMGLVYGGLMVVGYVVPRPLAELWVVLGGIGLCQGLFALFTMYLPALFPTALRTTGAGFCYNIGRIAAAVGTVVFGLMAPVDMRWALVAAAVLFVPGAWLALMLPGDAGEGGRRVG